jgi:two-component sensor histidine kinase/ligand-binding sensor domain-containing protein
MRSIWATLLLLCLYLSEVKAQQFNLKTWSLEEGLPQAYISDIAQDSSGSLWIGTSGGLSLFNGVSFRNFTKQNGLRSNDISCLFRDKKNTLWIGTSDQGLCSYDGIRFRHFSKKAGVPEGPISGIAQAPNSTIWITTSKGLAYLKNGKFKLLAARPNLPARQYSCILIAKNGEIWLGTLGNGLYRFNGKKAIHYSLEDGLSNKIIYKLFESSKHVIWIGTYGGITKFDGKKLTKYIPEGDPNLNRAVAFTELLSRHIFIGLDGGGLLKWENEKFTYYTTKNGLASNYLTSLLHDREGNLWIGTTGGGLQRYTPNGFTYFGLQDGLLNENITAIHRVKNYDLWLGSLGSGIAHYNGKNFTWFTQKDGLASNTVNDIKADEKGNLWIATNQGISFYNGNSFKTYTQDNGLIYNVVNFCLPDSGNKVWVATDAGFSYFNGKEFQNYRIPGSKIPNFIYTIFKDRQKRIWLGTKAGVYEFRDGHFIQHKELLKLNLHETRSITQDKYNNLWFASFNYGLVRFTPEAKTKRVALFNQKNGLLSEGITGVKLDSHNNLWIGTNRGLNCLNLYYYQKHDSLLLKEFGYPEGLRGIEINSNAMEEGTNGLMWFGTVKGLNRYNQATNRPVLCHPILNITEVRLFLQKTDWPPLGYKVDSLTNLPKELNLNHDQNYLTFNFHGICLTNPEEVTYSFRLKGFDKNWSGLSKEPSATYSNLSPGNYTFQVKACNKSGDCSNKITEYAFTIVPPFWSKDRVIGISILVVSTAVFGFVRWRENNLRKLNTVLEENVAQRTVMLERKNHEKEVLLKEVHHRVKNNLQIITSLLNLQSRHVSDPAALDTLREVKDRIKSISMLHQRLYQREELSCIDLSEYVQTLCRSLFASYGVREDHVRLEFDIPSLYLDIDTALTLGLIVNELVSNTLKYAFPEQRKGTLLIELLRVTETDYTLTISDDGTGLPDNFEEKMATSFGLQLVSSLIKKLHGSLKFYSQGGTQIRLQFVILPQ